MKNPIFQERKKNVKKPYFSGEKKNVKNPIFQERKKNVKKPYFSGEKKKCEKTLFFRREKKSQKPLLKKIFFTAKFIVKKFEKFLVVKNREKIFGREKKNPFWSLFSVEKKTILTFFFQKFSLLKY